MDMKAQSAAVDCETLLARHDYAIIDRAALFDESEAGDLPVEPLVPRILKNDAGKMPWLVPLTPGEPHMEMLAYHLECVEKGSGPCLLSCLLAAPESTPGHMGIHLTKRLILHSPRGGKDLLRYYDPRVFQNLPRILKPEQLRALYGPVTAWTFRFQDEWLTLPAPEVSGVVPEYWAVNDAQRVRLNQVILLHPVLDAHRKQLGRPWRDLDEYAAVADAASRALDAG
jgi:hypothetical protein